MSSAGVAAPRPGAARVRRALVLAGCGVLGVGLSACESTEQESARITRESQAAAAQTAPAPATSHSRQGHHSPDGKKASK